MVTVSSNLAELHGSYPSFEYSDGVQAGQSLSKRDSTFTTFLSSKICSGFPDRSPRALYRSPTNIILEVHGPLTKDEEGIVVADILPSLVRGEICRSRGGGQKSPS